MAKGKDKKVKPEDVGGYPAGSRLQRPHSAKGWTHNREVKAEPAKPKVKPEDISGYHVTGRTKKTDNK